MKKILLTIMMVTLLGCLTGCGTKEESTMEVKSEVDVICENAIESNEELQENIVDYLYCTEEEFEIMKNDTIACIEEDYENGYVKSEECKDEVIELINSLEYDTSFVYCYDYENLCKSFLEILRKYDELPVEADGYTIDELYEEIFA